MTISYPARALLLAAAAASASPALARQGDDEPRRFRVALGGQLSPSYPGADETSFGPLIDVSVAEGGEVFAMEAADEGIGLPLVSAGGFEFGPALAFQSSRKESEVGAPVGKVGGSFEVGAFVQTYVAPSLRLRLEGRRGIGGHDAFVGKLSADYVVRDGDRYIFAIGPRLTLSDAKYQRAYFAVTPAVAAATGLPAYRPRGGAQAAGVASSLHVQLAPRWGLYGFAQYDRLISDPADSPLVRAFGSRDQLSGGLAVSFTFGGGR